MKFSPRFMATHIAAMAHRDPEQACSLILKYFPEAPGIPRLTKSTRMYLEGIPCLVVDSSRRKLWFDISPKREKELIEFYERWEADDAGYFAISRESAPGMYVLLERLKEQPPKQFKVVHIQTPGPVSWGLSITDDQGKPAFYNETMRDILVKTLAMKAKWQERMVKQTLPDAQTMVDFGEPSLVVHTSAVGSGPREDIIQALNEVMRSVEGLTCIHCCANIDWSILMETRTDAINFDAYEYADKIALYPKELKAFLDRGGMLAWGIVPTSDDKIVRESTDTLMDKLERDLSMLIDGGIDRPTLFQSSILTPSCATSTMSLELGERAFQITSELSQRMREKYLGGEDTA
jgi:hypothetical protein